MKNVFQISKCPVTANHSSYIKILMYLQNTKNDDPNSSTFTCKMTTNTEDILWGNMMSELVIVSNL